MNSEKEELLKQSINLLIEGASLSPTEIRYEEEHRGRHTWARKVERNFRYIQIIALKECEFPGDYTISWGRHPGENQSDDCDEFDARSYGNLEHVLVFFKSWLIDLKEWHEPLDFSPPNILNPKK